MNSRLTNCIQMHVLDTCNSSRHTPAQTEECMCVPSPGNHKRTTRTTSQGPTTLRTAGRFQARRKITAQCVAPVIKECFKHAMTPFREFDRTCSNARQSSPERWHPWHRCKHAYTCTKRPTPIANKKQCLSCLVHQHAQPTEATRL